MSEQAPGIELYLSSAKAAAEAAKYVAAVDSAATAVERLGKANDQAQKTFDGLGAGARGAAKDSKLLGDEAKKTEDALNHYGEGARVAGKWGKDLGDKAAKAGLQMQTGARGAVELDQRLGRLGITSAGVGRSLVLLLGTAGAVSGIASGIRVFSDYEDKLRILGSIAGATGGELKKLESAAIDLSRSTRFSPREALDGLTSLSRAGLTAREAIVALKPTADLARVGLVGLDDAAGIVSKTITQFGLAAEEAGRVADVLAKGANVSNANVSTLADSLAKTGGVARQYGVSLEDTVAVLTRLADEGLAANIAGTGLQRVLIQLRSPTEEAKTALEGLFKASGPEAWNRVNPEKVGMVGALRNLANAGLTVQDSVSLVGTEFASLLSVLTGSVDKIERTGDALRTATGESARQAAAGADTLAAAFKDLANASEQFTVTASRGGVGGALSAIARTGADVLRILADDKKAMEEASTAAKLLATGLELAAVAGAVFATGKIAAGIGGLSNQLKQAAAATLIFDASTGTATARVGAASKAFATLTAVMRANPFVAAASAIAGVVSALYIFGDSSDEATDRLREQRERVQELDKQYVDLVRTLSSVGKVSLFDDKAQKESRFRKSRDELQKLGQELEALKGQQVPLEKVLGIGELSGAESQIGKIVALLKTVPQVMQEARTRRDRYSEMHVLNELRDRFKALSVEADASGQRFVEYEAALAIVRQGLADLDEKARAAGVSLPGVGDASKLTEYSSAVAGLVAEREKELKIAGLIGVEREYALLVADAEKRKNESINETESKKLRLTAEQTVAAQKLVDARRHEEEVARRAAKLQQDLPKNVEELNRKYEQELALARATGLQRELIRAEQEAENDAKEIGLALDDKRFQKLKAEKLEAAKLQFEQRQEKKEERVERRSNEALLDLKAEEELLKHTGAERERYRAQIEAENEARQAGLKLGTAEYREFVRRKVAAAELGKAMEKGQEAGEAFGNALSSALERAIFDMEKGRDVARAFAEDLARMAYRMTVTENLSKLLGAAGAGLAGLFAGGSAPSAAGGGTPNAFAGSGPSQFGADPKILMQTGGVIPAMGGQVVDDYSFLRRGGRTYSVAEGGKTTPEAIFPLQRDSQGRLGVAAAGGGGSTVINMSFPAVRNAQDARDMRATLGQRVRALRDADRRGRRGLRPRDS